MTTETVVAEQAQAAAELAESWDEEVRSADPLRFPGYTVPTPTQESVRTGLVDLAGTPAVWIDCDFARLGGTMGAVAGEKIVRAFDRATELGAPVAVTVSTGGARLQEGMVSLVQMGRTVAALGRHAAAGLRSAAYLRSPTTGGVFASFVSLTDVRAVEPHATVGFGGPRVVAEVTGQFPPASSHTAESALRHGLVDAIVEPADGMGVAGRRPRDEQRRSPRGAAAQACRPGPQRSGC